MEKESDKLIMIGKAKFKDFDVFYAWAHEKADQWTKEQWTGHMCEKQEEVPGLHGYIEKLAKLDKHHSWYFASKYNELPAIHEGLVEAGAACPLYYTDEVFSVIRVGGSDNYILVVPTFCLVIEYLKDYSNVPVSQLRMIKSGGIQESAPMDNALATISLNDIKSMKSEHLGKIQDLRKQIDDIKNARTGELKDLQAELDRMAQELSQKKEGLLAKARAKMEELEIMKKELEHKIFLLDSEIYSIRCFLGETVDFMALRTGKDAPAETPIVLYQKLRFLDEEMGRIAGLYNVHYGDYRKFEQMIKHMDTAFETFCPADKCISLVKVSKSGTYFQADDEVKNILKAYEMEHGHMIGILIRNGENLFFGWTDENKISFGEDLFYTPGVSEVSADDSMSTESTSKGEFASRYFVFSILQGILENTKMIQLPDKQSIFMPSKYVVYSAAEGWIPDNTYPTLQEVTEKFNQHTKMGDQVLVLLGLSGSDEKYDTDRGTHNNDKNRTHDCTVDSGLYNINLIEEGFDKERINARDKDGEYIRDENHRYVYETVQVPYKHYYVSVPKRWSDKNSRSNFKVYPGEFINIHFLSSDCIRYYITNNRIGSFQLGSRRSVDYAYMIRFLKYMLKWAEDREQDAAVKIIAHYPDLMSVERWRDKLMDWMFEKGVREITDYQAKRFAKHLVVK